MVNLSETSSQHTLNKPPIRSFVRREGRLTPAQQWALEELWPVYGLPSNQTLNTDEAFPSPASTIMEIGFGNGESLIEMAAKHPQFNYLGIEVHRPGIGHLLLGLDRQQLCNVRIYCADAVEIVNNAIADASMHRINVFFPDPWPKKRHHKRRLIQPDFTARLAQKLEPGGILHLATDWPEYAQHMVETLTDCPVMQPTPVEPLIPARSSTKYERRGHHLGHPVTDLAYIKA